MKDDMIPGAELTFSSELIEAIIFEIEQNKQAHLELDSVNVPRTRFGGLLSLAGRIDFMRERFLRG